jgi:CoA:oxalate CoA-transferase
MLEGLRVLSVGSYVAGPMASQIFANLGAEVIKIEHISGGDPYRYTRQYYDPDEPDDLAFRFLQNNRGKRSLPLNLKDQEGKEIFKSLAETADVIIENQRSGKMDEFGLGYSDISQLNEDLIYCSISGYGESGPYKDKPAMDGVIQSVSGLAHQNSQYAGEPMLDALFIADATSSVTAAFSILVSLISRMKGGSGTYIDVSLLDSLMSLFGSFASEYSASGTVSTDPSTTYSPYGIYETADSWIFIIVNDKQWDEFSKILGIREWAEKSGYDTLRKRKDEMGPMDKKLNSVLRERTTEEWLETFPDDMISEPVNSMEEAFTHPQVQHRDAIQERHDDTLGDFIACMYPPTSVNPAKDKSKPVPRFGEHSIDILSDLGYTADQIATFHENNITYSREL